PSKRSCARPSSSSRRTAPPRGANAENDVPDKLQRKGAAAKPEKGPEPGTLPGAAAPARKRWRKPSVKSKVLVQFTVQLATLQNAGLPIVRCLRILATQQREGPFRDAVSAVADDVEGGDSLSVAFGKHP